MKGPRSSGDALDSPEMAAEDVPNRPPAAGEPLDRVIEFARHRRTVGVLVVGVAVIGALLGLETLVFHLTTDPLADVHAYYDAGTRLNAGAPLYPLGADRDAPEFYRYPPLLAIAFRPLALLPYPTAASVWELFILVALATTLWRLGVRRPATWFAVAVLARPIAWTVAIGQAQAVVTLLLAFGSPLSVALAANLKLFPALVGLWWIGRRDWRSVRRFVAWSIGLGVLQAILAPSATLDFLRTTDLSQVGNVVNISPYALSPALWAILVLVGVAATLRFARTSWGWALAVLLGVVASPRLLTYMLSSLLAALRVPSNSDRAP
jgi:Glycosyltransferase family 87